MTHLIVGYLLSIVIGISLGLIGGGGSILTVPVLVYVFNVKPELATAYSLFIVGLTALTGSLKYWNHKLININIGLIFAIPSLIAVWLTRKFLMPAIPQEIFKSGDYIFTKDSLILGAFAIIMIFTSISMIRKSKVIEKENIAKSERHYISIIIDGLVVGALTGFIGAGGGFLIIPALVVLARIPMKIAVGTSLMIIAIKSLLGFTGDIFAGVAIDYRFLISVSVFSIAGMFVGFELSKKFHGDKLRPAFGWFVLAMGLFMFGKEIFLK